jgi:hypothetical protein
MANTRGVQGILCGPIRASDLLALGHPIVGIYISRTRLEIYGKEPERMAADFDELIYPVLRNQRLCGAEVLRRTNNDWSFKEFRDTRLFDRVQQSQFYLIFTTFDTMFVGRLQSGHVSVAPLRQFRQMSPKDFIPIDTVFSQLIELQ